ncbi:MAG TPA: S41 family peptidase [Thermoanaerobaculia bacterium]|nr:S41 family peptidase [Thermoanaerobaculia bacterium]
MRSPRSQSIAILLILLTASLGGGWLGGRLLAQQKQPSLDQQMREYADVLGALEEWAPHEVGTGDLIYGSIHGLVRALDPHSQFFAPRDYTEVRDKHAGSYYGVGLLVSQRENRVVVITPMEGGPAGRLGVRPGDVIVEVDAVSTENITYDKVTDMLRGPKGTPVEVKIRREGFVEPLHFTIRREAITTKAVNAAFLIEPGVAYIRVNDFTNTTEREFDAAIDRLSETELRGIIIDLRGNGGGVLDAAIAIADRFLEKGQMVAYTQGNAPGSNEQYLAPGTKARLETPLVVLVNQGSASASEIVAGAVQDHDRGLVVGEITWGKGLVQSVYNLGHGAGIALTTARYYTPSGRNIQRDYSSLYDYYTHEMPGEAPADMMFTTATGRTVYGGGGIRPDIRVALEQKPRVVQVIEARAIAFDLAVKAHSRDPLLFDRPIESHLLAEFEQAVLQRSILPEERVRAAFADAEVRPHFERLLKSELVAVAQGYENSYPFRLRGDSQIEHAIAALPDARKLAARAFEKRQDELARSDEKRSQSPS